MTFATVVSGIFAIAKAVPTVANYIEKFIDLYTQRQVDKLMKQYQEKVNKRAALMQAIKKAGTDEERTSLSIILADISRLSND